MSMSFEGIQRGIGDAGAEVADTVVEFIERHHEWITTVKKYGPVTIGVGMTALGTAVGAYGANELMSAHVTDPALGDYASTVFNALLVGGGLKSALRSAGFAVGFPTKQRREWDRIMSEMEELYSDDPVDSR